MSHPRTLALVACAPLLALAACSSSPTATSTTTTSTTSSSTTSSTSSSTTSVAPTSTAAAPSTPTAGTPPTSTSGAVSTVSGKELAASMRAASTGVYTVRTTVVGADAPMTISGHGSIADKSLAAHLEGDADTAQDVEVVAGKVYTSLPGFTQGRQRILVDLADGGDPLVDQVGPIVGACDLNRVLEAVAGAASATRAGDVVTAIVPGRVLVTLFGWGYDGSVPSSGPVKITLDTAGRPVRVVAAMHAATRTSTYSGFAPGARVVAPAVKDLVDSPL